MTFNGGKKALECGNCKYSRNLSRESDQVQDRPLGTGVTFEGFTRGLEGDWAEYACSFCKAHMALYAQEAPGRCLFCGVPGPEPCPQTQILTPAGILPFTFPYRAAEAKLAAYLSGNWLSPPDLKQAASPEHLRGVYVPVFITDAFTRNSWKAVAVFKVLEPGKSGPVEKQVNENVAGYYEHFFDDTFTPFSAALMDRHWKDIFDYRLQDAVPFDPGYTAEYGLEMYQQKESEALNKTNGFMAGVIERAAKQRIKGEQVKDLKLSSERMLLALRLVYVPVWVANYTYSFAGSQRRFQFLINGQTGTLSGDKPLDNRRILRAALGLVVLMIALVLIFRAL